MSLAPVVLVIVMLEEEVFTTFVGFPTVVVSFEVQANVVVLVKAGEMPEITALLDARVASPPMTRAVPPVAAFAQVAAPVVAPQKYAAVIPLDMAGNVDVTESVPASVIELLIVAVFPDATTSDPPPLVLVV
jgi:hypothetical protein